MGGFEDTIPPLRTYDLIVIGAGVAGLAFTLRLPANLHVAILTKGRLGESNTRYAQGGLAAAIGADDSPELHYADTIAAGAGLCDPDAVRALVEGAPAAVEWLLSIGTTFDQEGGKLLLGREGAHSRRRILHAGGDATGAELERALVAQVRGDPHVDIFEQGFPEDLLVANGRCIGVIAQLSPEEPRAILRAPCVVVATGGAGQLWATTSNPAGATADGVALALRAGVAVADLAFMQFHPTVLALPGTQPFLISEAVRGEGAYLRGKDGTRFMVGYHPMAELAPRDVVARAIQQQMAHDRTPYVYLDVRHLPPAKTRHRFPTIAAELNRRGINMATDLIPVAPAAHYFMGGIVATPTGQTSLPGLLALGEASCTGVHGANRLASNSLLEGLVFGLAAADQLGSHALGPAPDPADIAKSLASTQDRPISGAFTLSDAEITELRLRLQRTMSSNVAVIRTYDGLTTAAAQIRGILEQLLDRPAPQSKADGRALSSEHRGAALELVNMTYAATAITEAALRREESRGAHFRSDYPEQDPRLDGQHDILVGGLFGAWRTGPLSEGLHQPVAN
jgi:L-aspartate oxidase